jgi:hypothetical protein
MADGQLGYVLRHIRRLVGLPCAGDWSDGRAAFGPGHDRARRSERGRAAHDGQAE